MCCDMKGTQEKRVISIVCVQFNMGYFGSKKYLLMFANMLAK